MRAFGTQVETRVNKRPRELTERIMNPLGCLLMAHYMPWFEADPARKRWGWHWTMGHYRPDKITGERREIASRLYPLIGPYDSNDPDTLECHVLLMKLAGIDGVMIDWYGDQDFLDYGIIHRNTQSLIRFIKKAGLRYAVMYEDQTVPKLIEGKRLKETETIAHGKRLLEWMQTNWFRDPAYLKRDNRPVFMVFGSGYYKGEEWERIFAALPPPPLFFTESDRRPPAVGGFSWPQPGGGTDAALREVDGFYRLARTWKDFIPAAFPRFVDMYEAAGVHKSWGTIDDRDGKIYAETLERALKSDADIIQLVTWNDWGEGTIIEPSVEYGYRDLEATQRLRRPYAAPPLTYSSQDLRLPVTLYALRKKYKGVPKETARLEEAARFLFAGQTDKARTILAAFPDAAPLLK